jgi:hypothetical protein
MKKKNETKEKHWIAEDLPLACNVVRRFFAELDGMHFACNTC